MKESEMSGEQSGGQEFLPLKNISSQEIQAIFQAIPLALMLVKGRKIVVANQRFHDFFGFVPQSGEDLEETLRVLCLSPALIKTILTGDPEAIQNALKNTTSRRSNMLLEIYYTKINNGEEALFTIHNVIGRKQAERDLAQANTRLRFEIGERQRIAAELKRQASHDELTGLPNRRLFQDRFERAISWSLRNRRSGALMFIDLDKFKEVNDNLGHAAGDQLLQKVASRCSEQLRSSDTVARIGGDEFIVILPDVMERENAVTVACKILKRLRVPFVLNQNTVSISASIGMVLFPEQGVDVDELLKKADNAMYNAKLSGCNRYFFADS